MCHCPECGSSSRHHVSNRIDETPYLERAQLAPQFRHFGETSQAIKVLDDLSLVRIANFLRPQWRCLGCGVRFDD